MHPDYHNIIISSIISISIIIVASIIIIITMHTPSTVIVIPLYLFIPGAKIGNEMVPPSNDARRLAPFPLPT